MVNDSLPPIPQVEENKKQYTTHDVKRADCASQSHNITVQPVKQILHAVDKNILQNLSIMREDVGIDYNIYGTSVPHLQAKTVRYKIQHVESIIVPNTPKEILDRYKKVTLCCDLMGINRIGSLNTNTEKLCLLQELWLKT